MPSQRILVVDDDRSILRLVEAVLIRENYDVDTASGGREALSRIEQTQYDVVLLDLMMPVVSGFQVLEYLRARDPRIKQVVIMSAGSPLAVSDAITPNVFAVIRKPFDIEALVTAVRECIEAACAPSVPPRLRVARAA